MVDFEKYHSLLRSYQQLEQKLFQDRSVLFERLLDAYLDQHKSLYDRNRAIAPNFNPFNILGLATNELTHSDVLAWLFDPYGTHNQGDLFFRNFLTHFSFDVNYDPWKYKVRREYAGIESRIDILVFDKNFIFYIENKTMSLEGKDQTEREYRDLIRRAKTFGITKNIFPIFLNLKGEEPKDKHWRPIAYNCLAEALEKALGEVRADYVRFFVRSWLSTLKIIGGEL